MFTLPQFFGKKQFSSRFTKKQKGSAAILIFSAAIVIASVIGILAFFYPSNTADHEMARADNFSASNFDIWQCQVTGTTSINYAASPFDGITVIGNRSGESGDGWGDRNYSPDLVIPGNTVYRRNNVGTQVTVAPGDRVQINAHYINHSDRGVNVGDTFAFLSMPNPNDGDVTRLIQPGTNTLPIQDNGINYNSSNKSTSTYVAGSLITKTRGGKYVKATGEINLPAGAQGHRTKMFEFRAIQAVAEYQPRDVVISSQNGNRIVTVKHYLHNNSVYTLVGNAVSVELVNPANNQTVRKNVDIQPNGNAIVTIEMDLGKEESAPLQIPQSTIGVNRTFDETIAPQTNVYDDYGRSMLFYRNGNDGRWGTQTGRALGENPMTVHVLPYTFKTRENLLPKVEAKTTDLQLVKTEIPQTDGKTKYNPGDIAKYNLKITNNGPTAVTTFKVTEQAGKELEDVKILETVQKDKGELKDIVSNTNATTGVTTITLNWVAKAGQQLATGESIDITVSAKVKADGTDCIEIPNRARVDLPPNSPVQENPVTNPNAPLCQPNDNNCSEAKITTVCKVVTQTPTPLPPVVSETPVTPLPTVIPRSGGVETSALILAIVTLPTGYYFYQKQKKAEQVKLRWDY